MAQGRFINLWELAEKGPRQKRFALEGPWNIGDPVHETLTAETLKVARLVAPGDTFESSAAWEYVRGVFWNDDPEGALFDDESDRTNHYSTGLKWYEHYRAGKRSTTAPGPSDTLTARSHFGDLQFLHAMARTDGEPPALTQAALLSWAEFVYRIAVGDLELTAKVSDVPIKLIAETLGNAAGSIRELFGRSGPVDIRKRAVGSLLHLIQDSFARGHVQREPGSLCILNFHCYTHQNAKRHGHDDAWEGGGSDADRVRLLPGAADSIKAGAAVLELAQRSAPWASARDLLLQTTFALSERATNAGPGEYT